MKENPLKLDIDNYQKQGNLAIDMCAACIQHERKFHRPIKAIVLNPAYFSLLKKWVAKTYGEDVAEENDFFFDTVEIRQEVIYSGKILLVEYWPTEKIEA